MILCVIVILYLFSIPDPQSLTNKDLLFMSCMLSVFFFLPKISYFFIEGFIRHSTFPISPTSMSLAIPVASSPMTVCLFMRMRVAGPFALITAACTGIILQNRLEMFFYFMLNGLMAAYWIRHCREHKVFIQAGAKLGLLNIILAAALKLHTGEFISAGFLWDMGFAFMGGIGTGIISTGLVPLIEFAFNYTSDIRLLELSNLERPLLRRLMLEAPGTYHHSVVIGTMVEAAAAEIGAKFWSGSRSRLRITDRFPYRKKRADECLTSGTGTVSKSSFFAFSNALGDTHFIDPEMNFRAIICRPYETQNLSRRDNPVIPYYFQSSEAGRLCRIICNCFGRNEFSMVHIMAVRCVQTPYRGNKTEA
ncbi:MAG: hypothetical protein HC887_01615 [Desulfobacteraceae bacterium]|nr:hypothetical protein [Desulfobacteraceae bacterium]